MYKINKVTPPNDAGDFFAQSGGRAVRRKGF